jgi:hypothetical protein
MTSPTKKDTSFLMQRIFQFVSNEETKKQVQIYLLDPLMNHIMERVFPYIVLTSVLFFVLLLLVGLILGIILLQLRKSNAIQATTTSAAFLNSAFSQSN